MAKISAKKTEIEKKNKRQKISFFSKKLIVSQKKIARSKTVKKLSETGRGRPKKLSLFEIEKSVENPKIKTKSKTKKLKK